MQVNGFRALEIVKSAHCYYTWRAQLFFLPKDSESTISDRMPKNYRPVKWIR